MKNNPTHRASSLGKKRENLIDDGVSLVGESAGLEMRMKQPHSRSCLPSMACQEELCRRDVTPGLDGGMWRKRDSVCSTASSNRSS